MANFGKVYFRVFFAAALLASSVYGQQSFNIESVKLSKSHVYLPCPESFHVNPYCNEERATVRVMAVTTGVKGEGDEIYFVPTAGVVTGQGPEAVWNLSAVTPVEYSISVGIGSGGVVRGKVATAIIKVVECPHCDLKCICYELELVGPSGLVGAGDTFVVEAKTGWTGRGMRYRWNISGGGTIVDGRHGRKILIKASQTVGSVVNVTFDVEGTEPSCPCPTQASTTIKIQKR
jgi:hypothetical protein